MLSLQVLAQVAAPRLSIDAENLSWNEVVEQLQAQSPNNIYYKASDFDTLKFSIKVSNASMESILDQLFENTEFQYTIYEDNSIFITRDQPIRTFLTSWLFQLW